MQPGSRPDVQPTSKDTNSRLSPTHTSHIDLGSRGGDDPFHKGAASQVVSVTVLNCLSSNRVSPSFCYTRIQARTRTQSNMRLCFQILSNSVFTLYFPEWPRISCPPPDRINQSFSSLPKSVFIQSRLCNVFWDLSIIFKTPNTKHFQPFKNYPESQFSIKISLELFTQIHLLFVEPFSLEAAPFFQALPLHWPKGYKLPTLRCFNRRLLHPTQHPAAINLKNTYVCVCIFIGIAAYLVQESLKSTRGEKKTNQKPQLDGSSCKSQRDQHFSL